jgi:integrase
VLALRWSHIYTTDNGGEMKIVHGKGRKERVISLPEELSEALREMRADRRGIDEDFVFTSQKGGQSSWIRSLPIECGCGLVLQRHYWKN